MASEGFTIRLVRDDVTASLGKTKEQFGSRLHDILEAIGLQVVSIAKRAFREEDLRASPWPARRFNYPWNPLLKSGFLQKSIAITNIGPTSVTFGSDKLYAAVQQLGGTILPKPGSRALVFTLPDGTKVYAKKVTIPARPFFPVTSQGELTQSAAEKVNAIINDAVAGNFENIQETLDTLRGELGE